jgi:hypothetical protein
VSAESGESGALLRRFQPCLRYDSLEAYFADDAAEWTLAPGHRLRRRHGDALAGADLALDRLDTRYADGTEADPADVIEATDSRYGAAYAALRTDHQELRNVIYGRAVRGAHDLWLQYWFFYFLNDYQLAWGIDVHEGDWEMIQLRLEGDGDAARAVEAAYAQHTFCEVRAWEDVWRLDREKREAGEEPAPGDEDRPLVFVGRGSHASFFQPGYHPTDFYDITDGRQRAKTDTRLVDVTEAPGWLRWPGHWGGERTGYKGPSAPRRHAQWGRPDALLATAREVPLEPEPGAPRLAVRRRRGHLAVDVDATTCPDPLDRLIVTVNCVDDAKAPPRVFRFGVAEAAAVSLETRIDLDPKRRYDVRVAVVDTAGRPTAAQVFWFLPSRFFRDLLRRAGALAGRLIWALRVVVHGDEGRRTDAGSI